MRRVSSTILPGLFLALIGCSGDESGPHSAPPMAPVLQPGMASLRGRVVNIDRQPVAGATIRVLDMPASEAPRTATSAADGSWELVVPGNTTVTLRAELTGLAGTLSSSFQVTKGQTSTELELMMLTTAFIDQLNTMGGSRPADYGAVAIEVQSLTGACDPVGGKITIEPPQLGRVFYSRPGSSVPDATLSVIQGGGRPAAWLLGVLPPGAYYRLEFAKTGCTAKVFPVEYRGRSYDGGMYIATKTLSNGFLFVQ